MPKKLIFNGHFEYCKYYLSWSKSIATDTTEAIKVPIAMTIAIPKTILENKSISNIYFLQSVKAKYLLTHKLIPLA